MIAANLFVPELVSEGSIPTPHSTLRGASLAGLLSSIVDVPGFVAEGFTAELGELRLPHGAVHLVLAADDGGAVHDAFILPAEASLAEVAEVFNAIDES